ncbi:MAG: hypothetical protein RLZ12_91, partial [Bacillota bacterium]
STLYLYETKIGLCLVLAALKIKLRQYVKIEINSY